MLCDLITQLINFTKSCNSFGHFNQFCVSSLLFVSLIGLVRNEHSKLWELFRSKHAHVPLIAVSCGCFTQFVCTSYLSFRIGKA